MKYHQFLLGFMILTWLIEEYILSKLKVTLNEVLNTGGQQSESIISLKKVIDEGVRGKFIKIKPDHNKLEKLIFYYNLSYGIFLSLLILFAIIRVTRIVLR